MKRVLPQISLRFWLLLVLLLGLNCAGIALSLREVPTELETRAGGGSYWNRKPDGTFVEEPMIIETRVMSDGSLYQRTTGRGDVLLSDWKLVRGTNTIDLVSRWLPEEFALALTLAILIARVVYKRWRRALVAEPYGLI